METRLFKNLGVKKIKKTSTLLTFIFVLVTVLMISNLILIMVFEHRDMDNYVETESHQADNPSEYWTKERMEEAKPQPIPTIDKTELLKEIVYNSLPILIILFVILIVVLTLRNMRMTEQLERQNKKILNKLSDIDEK